MDFLFANIWGHQSYLKAYYSEYAMNIMCKYEKKIKVRFSFIRVFRKYLFCIQLYGK